MKNNPEHRAAYEKARYLRERERLLEYQRQYRAKHREELNAAAKERSRKHYEANREKLLARQRARRVEKRETLAAYAREYGRTHREESSARARAWREKNKGRERERLRRRRKENPLEGRARTRRHRAAVLGAAVHHTADEMAGRAALFGNACAYCGGPWEHDDHSHPVSVALDDSAANMVPACGRCNKSKGQRDARTYIRRRLALREPVTERAARFAASHDHYWLPDDPQTAALRGVAEG